ncbi:phosphoribosyltransferase [Embleya sp. NPDC059237]|uniref:phosphoribosyltransferase n=1 Tax=Embleya sp. NPDC059237 TaxID=3346784 RepID=UPI00368F701C
MNTPQRVFTRIGPLVMSKDAYDAAITILADHLLQRGPVHMIIGIANGGTRPARDLAQATGAALGYVEATHNATDRPWSPATGLVRCALPADFPRSVTGRVLVADDICGSGATFTAVRDLLAKRLAPPECVETVALCRNTGAPPNAPDLWAWDVDDWVVFPWEQQPDPTTPTRSLPMPEAVKTP